MIRKRNGVLRLGICVLAALSILAITAGTAQAEEGAQWHIEGQSLSELPSELESITGSAVLPLFLETLELGVKKECQKLALDEALITEPGHLKGNLLFTECLTYLLNSETGEFEDPEGICDPAEPVVLQGLGLLILHNEKSYILFEPQGSNFTILHFEAPCPLPEEVPLTGTVVAECVKVNEAGEHVPDDCATEKVTQLIRMVESPTLFPEDKVFFGENEMHVFGTAALQLSGADIGEKWSGHAG